ncbi:hypothetical protein RchiOBHm_Chr2g0131391 [Rosa chinensis]|uniref:Uncharacterized protein n=1 Tax=Rosa chinensis TaxID=74649 RepID=A0A2P6RV17_ROSCH|nr:hypothetical protein RchiOBHm_Chr2g0131391 [Rosa chinensis]
MHQHRGSNGGVWINEEAEKTWKILIGELIKTKQQLVEFEGTPLEEVIVPIPMQLDILAKELGTMKGKTIRGVDYGLKKDRFCSSIPASTSNPTNAQLIRYIVLLDERLASLEGEKQPQPPTHDVDEEGGEEGDEDEDLDVL